MKRIYRNPSKGSLGGVCHGLGYYFNADPLFFRAAFIISSILVPKIPLLTYLVMWFIIPAHPSSVKKTSKPTPQSK